MSRPTDRPAYYGAPPPRDPHYGTPPPHYPQHGTPPLRDPYYGAAPPRDPHYGAPPPRDYRYGTPPPHDPRYGDPSPWQDPYYGAPPPRDPYYGAPPPRDPYYGAPPPRDFSYGDPSPRDPHYSAPSSRDPHYGAPSPDDPHYGEGVGSPQDLPPSWEEADANESPLPPGPPVMIALMGATGAGKSQFINLASNSNLHVGKTTQSCTVNVQTSNEFTLGGRKVVLIDTPGFDDTSTSDTEILGRITSYLALKYEKRSTPEGSTLAGVIFLHRISDNRFGGVAKKNFGVFRKLCGDSTLKSVIIATTMWEKTPPSESGPRQEELSTTHFKDALDKGARMVRHANTPQSAHKIIRTIIENAAANKEPVVLQIQRELVDDGKKLHDTAAGVAVNQELHGVLKKHETELKEANERMAQALKTKDEETKREMEEVKKDLEKKMEKIKKDSEGMDANYTEKRTMLEVTIPIYEVSNPRREIGRVEGYLATDKLSVARHALLQRASRHSPRAYIEVILKGDTEGDFLDAAYVHKTETMSQVSKLVYWTAADIDVGVKTIRDKLADQFGMGVVGQLSARGFSLYSKAASTGISAIKGSLTGNPTYYTHLLNARNARSHVNPSAGLVGKSAGLVTSFAGNLRHNFRSIVS